MQHYSAEWQDLMHFHLRSLKKKKVKKKLPNTLFLESKVLYKRKRKSNKDKSSHSL